MLAIEWENRQTLNIEESEKYFKLYEKDIGNTYQNLNVYIFFFFKEAAQPVWDQT